jgi:glutamate--cysteine ligase catalytic subunit
MDIQLTEFENSSLIVLLIMINNLINHYRCNFLLPISKIDENMKRAHKRDAINKGKFWFKVKNFIKEPEDISENLCSGVKAS